MGNWLFFTPISGVTLTLLVTGDRAHLTATTKRPLVFPNPPHYRPLFLETNPGRDDSELGHDDIIN